MTRIPDDPREPTLAQDNEAFDRTVDNIIDVIWDCSFRAWSDVLDGNEMDADAYAHRDSDQYAERLLEAALKRLRAPKTQRRAA